METKCYYLVNRYKLALEENRKGSDTSEKGRKRQLISEEVYNVKRGCMEMQSCITMLNKDIEGKEGEGKHDIYFLKANALRKTIKEKEDLVRSLDNSIMKIS